MSSACCRLNRTGALLVIDRTYSRKNLFSVKEIHAFLNPLDCQYQFHSKHLHHGDSLGSV